MASFMHDTQCLGDNELIQDKHRLEHVRWDRGSPVCIGLVLYIEYEE
jgi:hypothetical protein